jgi:predicted CXXCH cytochrome family protein
MAASPTRRWRKPHTFPWRVAGLLLVLAGVISLIGCSSPRERYKVLSFFFDGVPDPDAPNVSRRPVSSGRGQVILATIVSTHKPYKEGKCDSCHRSTSGEILEFEDAYKNCVSCHKGVSTGRKLMHGPVAREVCRFCHTPHESTEPALLKASSIKVCTACHDQQLLGNNPPEHLDGQTSCLNCHFGHGGDSRYFLKLAPVATQPVPGTWPALPAATAPTSHPAPTVNLPDTEHAP